MLIKQAVLEGIARGEITLAFRRWKKPTVTPGTALRTALGELSIRAVSLVEEASLTEEDARRAGFASLPELKEGLRRDDGRALYRIEFCGLEPDRRTMLREEPLDSKEAASLAAKLARWDKAGGEDGYHRRVLELIAAEPGIPAGRLAGKLGVEKLKFKRDVRKLKELGLTESLKVGYRISPRGKGLLDMLGTGA
ncbi:ASCH domain-containing protein [Chelativorans sp.]|uniref:ASCH domain-containing protein n=1 Tax=Chelativorans sp. TaxID=2203393 RepID=UPI0028119D9B|nr:ASCH domain-containing protein [Chelativorans sp.]